MKRMLVCLTALWFVAQTADAGVQSVPKDYKPDRSWPVVVSTQDNPRGEVMKDTPFFVLHSGGQGVECSTKIESDLLALAAKYNIDPLRIYATSFSRGGHEILLQTADHPDWFAAIAPVDHDLRNNPASMKHVCFIRTPVLQLHGRGDMFRQTGKVLFDQMKEAGTPITWTDYAGGHDPRPIWDKTPKVWMSFFAKHVLNPYPKKIEHEATHKRYGRAYWLDITVSKDAGGLNAAVAVSVEPNNVISVKSTEDVAGLDLYLTDKLVDMKKPVKVVEGEKVLFEGPVAEKITVKIREGTASAKKERPALWEQLTAAGKKANFEYKPIDLAAIVEALPDTMPPVAPATPKPAATTQPTSKPASKPVDAGKAP